MWIYFFAQSETGQWQDWIGTVVIFLLYGLMRFFSDKKEKKNPSEEKKPVKKKKHPIHSEDNIEPFRFQKEALPEVQKFDFPHVVENYEKKQTPSRLSQMIDKVPDKRDLLIYKEVFGPPIALRADDNKL